MCINSGQVSSTSSGSVSIILCIKMQWLYILWHSAAATSCMHCHARLKGLCACTSIVWSRRQVRACVESGADPVVHHANCLHQCPKGYICTHGPGLTRALEYRDERRSHVLAVSETVSKMLQIGLQTLDLWRCSTAPDPRLSWKCTTAFLREE